MRKTKSSQDTYIRKTITRVNEAFSRNKSNRVRIYIPSITDAEMALLKPHFKTVKKDCIRLSYVWFER